MYMYIIYIYIYIHIYIYTYMHIWPPGPVKQIFIYVCICHIPKTNILHNVSSLDGAAIIFPEDGESEPNNLVWKLVLL